MILGDLEVVAYRLPGLLSATLELCNFRKGQATWAIRCCGECLSKTSKSWVYEPLPSSRSDEFLKDCRWSDAQEALDFYLLIDRPAEAETVLK